MYYTIDTGYSPYSQEQFAHALLQGNDELLRELVAQGIIHAIVEPTDSEAHARGPLGSVEPVDL